MITIEKLSKIEELLDERLEMALDTDKRMGNEGDSFLPNNPDYLYYKGMIKTLDVLGYDYYREGYKHTVFVR